MSPPKQSQFHTPAISSQKSPAHQTPQKKGPNVFHIPGHKRRYRGKDFTPNPEPWLPPQKEVSGCSLLQPLKSYWKTSSTEQGGKGKRTPPGKRPRMLKLYRYCSSSQSPSSQLPSSPSLPTLTPCITLSTNMNKNSIVLSLLVLRSARLMITTRMI